MRYEMYLWMLIVGSWLFLLSDPKYMFSFAGCISWNGMEEGRRDKEASETIKTQLHYYGSLQLSLETRRPPFLAPGGLFFFFWDCSSYQRPPRILIFFCIYFVFFIWFYFILIAFIYYSISICSSLILINRSITA